MTASDIQINFSAPASLRKWASVRSERLSDVPAPYLIQEATLEECMSEFLLKPVSQHHLYEVHTDAQEPWVKAVLSAKHVYELVRLRKLLTF